jgi:serine/threonine protein kinase
MDLHKCICALSLGFLFMTVIRRKPFLNILMITINVGTPYYTAPEMIQNLKYSYPVDCW